MSPAAPKRSGPPARPGHTLDAEPTIGTPDLATAYAIQRALLGLRLAAGERVVGWKLGYTSEVMRRQMGIDRPNIGPLTDWMLLGSGEAVHERLVQPRVEPEIGLRLKTALDARQAPVDRHNRGRRRGRRLRLPRGRALDLDRLPLQPRTEHRRHTPQPARLSSGRALPVTDLMALDTVAVRLHDGSDRTLGQGVGADADGHPLDAVARLARELAANDQRLEAGDWVITGGLTKACALEPGGQLVGVFSAGGVASITVVVNRR